MFTLERTKVFPENAEWRGLSPLRERREEQHLRSMCSEAERGRLQANKGFCGEFGLEESQKGFAMIGFALEG